MVQENETPEVTQDGAEQAQAEVPAKDDAVVQADAERLAGGRLVAQHHAHRLAPRPGHAAIGSGSATVTRTDPAAAAARRD